MENRPKNIADAYKWSKETAQALRTGDMAAIDVDEQIDEVGLRFLLRSAPSLHEAVPAAVDEAYQWAKDNVIEDYGVTLPNRLVAEGQLA